MELVVFCDNKERFDFFKKLFANYQSTTLIVSCSPALCSYVERSGWKAFFAKVKSAKFEAESSIDFSEDQFLEVVTRKISCQKAREIFLCFYWLMPEVLKTSVKYVFIWNGSRILEEAARCHLRDNREKYCNTKLFFLEISNIPGKIFIDPEGVNANSFYYRNVSSINKLLEKDVGEFSGYSRWLEGYLAGKKKQVGVAQSRFARRIDMYPVKDYLYSLLGKTEYRINFLVLLRAFFGRLVTQAIISKISKDRVVGECEGYIFIPLQVSGDTQLKLHGSGFDNVSLINHVVSENREKKVLVTKIHPSENDIFSLMKIARCLNNNKILVSAENTFYLIENSYRVYTINSTVGLEAKLAGATCVTLGEAIYSSLESERDLAAYVFGWLVDLDYFAPPKADRIFFEKLDERYEIYRRLSAN